MAEKMVTITEERFLELLDSENDAGCLKERVQRFEASRTATTDPHMAVMHTGLVSGFVDKEEYDSLKADAERWRKRGNDLCFKEACYEQDAKLGALVRQMPVCYRLDRMSDGQWRYWDARSSTSTRFYPTPEEALRAGLGKVLRAESETPKENEEVA